MSNSSADIDFEINSLLESIGFSSNANYDIQDSKPAKEIHLERDFDGTPIIGKEVARKKSRRIVKVNTAPKEKKDGRGRPQNKTFNCESYKDINSKLGIILGSVYKKFSTEVIETLQSQHLLEIVIIPNDGYSSCDRIRMYVGKIDESSNKRDKCKGRVNCYERKGVFPIVDFVYAISQSIENDLEK